MDLSALPPSPSLGRLALASTPRETRGFFPLTPARGNSTKSGPSCIRRKSTHGNQVHIGPTGSTQNSGGTFLVSDELGNVIFEITGSTVYVNGVMFPYQSSSAPIYQKGAVYFDTSLNKLRVGGATNWETINSV